MRTFNGVQNGDSERFSNVPKVTQPWSGQPLGGGEWKANWGLEDGEKISQQFTGNAFGVGIFSVVGINLLVLGDEGREREQGPSAPGALPATPFSGCMLWSEPGAGHPAGR